MTALPQPLASALADCVQRAVRSRTQNELKWARRMDDIGP